MWHFDTDGLSAPVNILPDFNAWYGAGKNVNLGLGSAFVWPSHFSATRYWANRDNYWIAYGHFQPLNPGESPFAELGGGYSFGSASTSQTLLVGVGLGYKPIWGGRLKDGAAGLLTYLDLTPQPILKYTGEGSDLGISWTYSPGLSKRSAFFCLHGLNESPDTLWRANEIDSIILDGAGPRPRNVGLTIKLITGETERFQGLRVYPDALFANYDLRFFAWSDRRYMFFNSTESGFWFIGDYEALQAAATDAFAITILSYPEGLKRKVEKINALSHDHSFGVGIFDTYNRNKR